MLFSVGGLFALYEAYHKWHEIAEGHAERAAREPLVVGTAGRARARRSSRRSLSFRTAIVESNKTRGTQSWKRFIRSAKAPELPVILLEDFAALLGLVFALFGVGLTLITHNAYFDVIGTAMIGLLLVAVAVALAIETKSLLLGESAGPDVGAADRAGPGRAPTGVDRLIHMKTLHLGPEEILVAAKIAVTGSDTATEVADIINRAEIAIREAEPMVTALYLEPDL